MHPAKLTGFPVLLENFKFQGSSTNLEIKYLPLKEFSRVVYRKVKDTSGMLLAKFCSRTTITAPHKGRFSKL